MRPQEADFDAAKTNEVEGVSRCKLWRMVTTSNLPKKENILSGKLIYRLSKVGSSAEMEKILSIAQGFGDCGKLFMLHEASTLRASSILTVH